MRKLLRPQDILLLGLSGALDIFEEIRDPLSIFSKSYENMYGFVPRRFRRNNFTHLVWRSLKTGYIEKIIKNNKAYFRLTSVGKERIKRDFPLFILQKEKWDGKWRVVVFDIEETNRNARDIFREKLKELGFGMLQKSVFITPHDVLVDFYEFVVYQGLFDQVYAMEVSQVIAGDVKRLADKVWHLGALNSRYEKIIEQITKKDLSKSHDRGKQLNKVMQEYLEILLQDPFLPKELLPEDWRREEAERLIQGLRKRRQYG
ncbi:MAG: CRISPR-associated endonuclease Cas2 [Candidatus Levybacteria bacterium]|nr:CRISPR-associated endonuclease Cas2 [Candidatus Levybacteria bacterium]